MRKREDDCLTYAHARRAARRLKIELAPRDGWENQPPRKDSPKTSPAPLDWIRRTAPRSARQYCLEERRFAACKPSFAHGISSLCFEFSICHPILDAKCRHMPASCFHHIPNSFLISLLCQGGRPYWLNQNDTFNPAYSTL